MKTWIIAALLYSCCIQLKAQGLFRRFFPKSAATAQFAGSTGFWTIGYSRVSERERLELGILYGKVPRSLGGVVHSFTLKLTYNPFKIPLCHHWQYEPLQAGLFTSQSFGTNVGISWPDKYPKGYYWWPRGLREHVFVSTQLSWLPRGKHIDKISAYFEANTNDLYIYSFASNMKALYWYDIFFLGCGLKVYFH